MKTGLIWMSALIATILFSGSSCENKNIKKANNKYLGTWHYIGYSGGIAGFSFRPDASKNNFLRLMDSTYINLQQDEQKCGTYKIADEVGYAVVKGPYLIFDDNTTGSAIHLNQDTLVLTQPVADGMSIWYIKKDTSLNPCTEVSK